MGIEGASLATGIAQTSFTLLIGLYMWRYARTIRFYKPKFTKKSIRLTLRNVGCQAKLGISSMIGELAIACMMFTGNLAFLKYLGEDGVAAFSVACYCFPFVFMIGNAIAQSAQPIISYNHGAGLPARVSQTFRLSIGMGLAFGLLAMLGGIAEGVWGSHLIVSVFLPETAPANGIAGTGMPYFSGAFLFFTINIVCIGYFQSLGRFKPATTFMLLRGVVFMIPSFILLPLFIGTNGLWLAVPLSEAVTLLFIILYYLYKNKLETIKNTFMKNLLFGILVPAIFLTACQQQQPETKPAEYAVMTIQTGDVAQTESYSASIQGRQDIEIYPQVSGTIQKVCVKEGQEVNRGQLLFVIDQVPYRAALHTAIANVRSAEAQEQTARLSYNSKKKLHEEEVISEYDLSTARNALSVAEASLEQAKAQEVHARNALSYTEVKSPANGAVGTIPYRVGALVSSTSAQPLTTVSDNSEMYVYFSMSEQQLQSLVRRYGSIRKTVEQMPAVKLQLSDGSVYEKEGRIESISGVLNKQTGSGSLLCRVSQCRQGAAEWKHRQRHHLTYDAQRHLHTTRGSV